MLVANIWLHYVLILKSSLELVTATNLSLTDRLQAWNELRKRKQKLQTVCDIDFSTKVYGKNNESSKKTLHDPRPLLHWESNYEMANQDLLNEIKKLNPNCGFYKVLSSKILHQKSHIIFPNKEHALSLEEIYSKAKRIRKNIFVEERKREQISLLTKKQSECLEWFEHSRVRITASKCKRTIQKPTTSPAKAVKEILQCTNKFQRKK